jgi:hypothetical protein
VARHSQRKLVMHGFDSVGDLVQPTVARAHQLVVTSVGVGPTTNGIGNACCLHSQLFSIVCNGYAPHHGDTKHMYLVVRRC